MDKFLGIILLIAAGVGSLLLKALVISDLLRWFQLYTLTYAQAVGLVFVASLLLLNLSLSLSDKPDAEDGLTRSWNNLLARVLVTLVAWGMGWLYAHFLFG